MHFLKFRSCLEVTRLTILKTAYSFFYFSTSRNSVQSASWVKLFQIMILYSVLAHVIVPFTKNALILL